MVPDKFNMIDMGGIDLIMMQGEEVPGLYDRLVESITQCRYQCLYNWLFDGVIIPPSYVKMEVNENEEVEINEGITISQDDVIHIYSLLPPSPDPEIIPLLAEENGTYTVPTGKHGFNPVTVDVPSYTPVINPITITENGTYNVPSGVDGFGPVVVNVPSSGEIPLLSRLQWQSLSAYQKKSYGLVAIQDATAGYLRGDLVNGADYIGEMVQSGTGTDSITDFITVSGSYVLAVLALNSEASTYQLNINAKINETLLTGETVIFNSYSGSGDNRRNYRLNQYFVSVNSGDAINIEITNRNYHSSFVWALLDVESLILDKAISTADSTAIGSNTNDGFVLKGIFNDASGGTIIFEPYSADTIISTQNPGTSYKSAYIFWFT